jgi:hypothetical protein
MMRTPPRGSISLALLLCPFLQATRALGETNPTMQPGIESTPHFAPLPRPLPIGQPGYHRFEWGPLGGYGFKSEQSTYRFFVDMEGRAAAPQFGLLDVAFEGLYGRVGRESEGAFGASLKLLNVRGGFEYDFADRKPYVKLSLQGAPRRGGILGRGDRVRIDYMPGRKRLEAGIKMPFPWADYRATRPRNAHVAMPHGWYSKQAAVDSAFRAPDEIARVRHAIEQVDRMLTPNLAPRSLTSRKGRATFEAEARTLAEHLRLPGHSFAAEDSAYHACLEAAFAAAAGRDSAAGEALANTARGILLQTVIVPYDRLLGRVKRPGEPKGFLAKAGTEFSAAVEQPEFHLSAAQRTAAREVFRQVSVQLGEATRAARRRWHSWRLVWIPLNFGLKPDQYDTQAEVNALIGDLVDHSFSSTNRVRYIFNDDFLAELRRSILETQRYQVLWIHDYSGRNGTKTPDRIAWDLAVEGYLEAFVRAIEEMDRGARDDLPEFLILLDEFYYRGNGSEAVISFLESLGSARSAPSLANRELRARVQAGVDRLRKTIAASSALRARGERYVRQRVKVQVVVTHPYDPTFVDDMVMRDHTKVAFRDVLEDDPTSGEAFFTGLGIGEHYVGPHWEDRTLAVRGTETASIKAAARALLATQGLKPGELPGFLRQRPYPASFEETCDSLRGAGWAAHVLTVTNGTGYRTKSATVLKAAIYNLAQRGSVLLAPDSLWTSDFWAAMFISAAIRGCHVFPIAPALENAPSSALSTMGVMHETMWMLFRSSELLAESIRDAGGTLRVGLYTNDVDVADVRSLVRRMLERDWGKAPLRDQIHIHPAVLRVLREKYAGMEGDSTAPVHAMAVPKPHKPHLHLKAQFFANETALSLLAREEWADVLAHYLDVRRRQTLGAASPADVVSPDLIRGCFPERAPAGVDSSARGLQDAFERGDAIALSTLGSHNQDRRSMLLDGEVLTAVAGEDCLASMLDFAFLMETATWPEKVEDLDAAFPETSTFLRRLSRWLRDFI